MFGFEPFQPLFTPQGMRSSKLRMRGSKPSVGLSRYVHSFVQVSVDKPTPYPVIPDGIASLFISKHATLLVAAMTKVTEFTLPEPGDYFGVRFVPGAIHRILGLDLSETRDQIIDTSRFKGSVLAGLHAKLYPASYEKKVAVTESLLGECWAEAEKKSAKVLDMALRFIYSAQGRLSIEDGLADKLSISPRQLNRIFSTHIGMSAKRFAQVIRMQNVCAYLEGAPSGSLMASEIYGYFDQAHLLKDFKKHLSAYPEAFFKRFQSDFYNTDKS
ncbi:MAG: helix-turn-helix domain-containing protein [Agarilytica sp.]